MNAPFFPAFHPVFVASSNAPPGIVASTTPGTITRAPVVTGSSAGTVGMVIIPLNASVSSPGGVSSLPIASFALSTAAPVQGSQASPIPSPSVSVWSGSATSGQSSSASHTPSPSWSRQTATMFVTPKSRTSASSRAASKKTSLEKPKPVARSVTLPLDATAISFVAPNEPTPVTSTLPSESVAAPYPPWSPLTSVPSLTREVSRARALRTDQPSSIGSPCVPKIRRYADFHTAAGVM